jgi:hypothetical protein
METIVGMFMVAINAIINILLIIGEVIVLALLFLMKVLWYATWYAGVVGFTLIEGMARALILAILIMAITTTKSHGDPTLADLVLAIAGVSKRPQAAKAAPKKQQRKKAAQKKQQQPAPQVQPSPPPIHAPPSEPPPEAGEQLTFLPPMPPPMHEKRNGGPARPSLDDLRSIVRQEIARQQVRQRVASGAYNKGKYVPTVDPEQDVVF